LSTGNRQTENNSQKKLALAQTVVAKANHFFLLIRQLPACRTGRKLTANDNDLK